MTQTDFNMTDTELDTMLAEWADAELDVPEGFHESVMMRLRADAEIIKEQTVQAPQKKGVLVSLSERFANKKAWVSTIAAAALILCCMPVLQERQDNMADVGNSAGQRYEMENRSITAQDGGAETMIMMTSLEPDTQDIAASTDTVNGTMASTAKLDKSPQASYDYAIAEDCTELTSDEQLTLAQGNLAELEAHLATLDDSTEHDTLRENLLKKISELQAEIKALEAQISEEEITTAE